MKTWVAVLTLILLGLTLNSFAGSLIVQGPVTGSSFISNATDGEHYGNVDNTVSISRTPGAGDFASYGGDVFFSTAGVTYNTKFVLHNRVPTKLGWAISDNTTNLTVSTPDIKDRMPCTYTVTEVRVVLNTAATTDNGSLFKVDVFEGDADADGGNPVSILATKVTLDSGHTDSTYATTPPTLTVNGTTIAKGAEITFGILTVGNLTPGKGAKVWLDGYCSE